MDSVGPPHPYYTYLHKYPDGSCEDEGMEGGMNEGVEDGMNERVEGGMNEGVGRNE